MIENGVLKTKARGVSVPHVQDFFKEIYAGQEVVTKVSVNPHSIGQPAVIVETESGSRVHIGILKGEYRDFLMDLHNPKIRYHITGGGYVLSDNTGQRLREVGNYDELTYSEKELIRRGLLELMPKNHGFNLEIAPDPSHALPA
jgi:hypothetical protein